MLYIIPKGIFNRDAYYLKYFCPSTMRCYVSGIEPKYAEEHKDADAAMAWKLSMTPKEYASLTLES